MPRKDFTFRYAGTATLCLDPEEFRGCSVPDAERSIRESLRGRGNGREEYEPVDVTLAALELAGG